MKKSSVINTLSTEIVRKDLEEAPCLRSKLDTGTLCNYDCSFCYYQGSLDQRKDLIEIKRQADNLKEYGIQDIELSGGESSISPDWFEILDYVREKGFRHISTLSHGGKFANMDFLKKSYDKGLREVLFSLHGGSAKVHNRATNRGSSFDTILKAISNAQELGMIVRINCTVYHQNYQNLEEHAELCKKINPLEVNYITLNHFDAAESHTPILYKDLAPKIKEAIYIIKDTIKYINVRYIPFCFMKGGYEKYVCDTYQHIYDRYDWNLETYDLGPNIFESHLPRTFSSDLELAYTAAKEGRLYHYNKPSECVSCSRLAICDGIDTKDKVLPIPGEYITNPVYFRKGMYKDYDSEIESVSNI